MVLGMLAENSLSFAVAPVIVELAQTLALDKVALQGIKLSRTAASYKMVHGLGQTFSERIFSNMRRFPFSLNVDESTSNNNKKVGLISLHYIAIKQSYIILHFGCIITVFPSQFFLFKVLYMLVCYHHDEFGKVMVEHLGSLEIMKANAANLERVI